MLAICQKVGRGRQLFSIACFDSSQPVPTGENHDQVTNQNRIHSSNPVTFFINIHTQSKTNPDTTVMQKNSILRESTL